MRDSYATSSLKWLQLVYLHTQWISQGVTCIVKCFKICPCSRVSAAFTKKRRGLTLGFAYIHFHETNFVQPCVYILVCTALCMYKTRSVINQVCCQVNFLQHILTIRIVWQTDSTRGSDTVITKSTTMNYGKCQLHLQTSHYTPCCERARLHQQDSGLWSRRPSVHILLVKYPCSVQRDGC